MDGWMDGWETSISQNIPPTYHDLGLKYHHKQPLLIHKYTILSYNNKGHFYRTMQFSKHHLVIFHIIFLTFMGRDQGGKRSSDGEIGED